MFFAIIRSAYFNCSNKNSNNIASNRFYCTIRVLLSSQPRPAGQQPYTSHFCRASDATRCSTTDKTGFRPKKGRANVVLCVKCLLCLLVRSTQFDMRQQPKGPTAQFMPRIIHALNSIFCDPLLSSPPPPRARLYCPVRIIAADLLRPRNPSRPICV